MKRALMLCVSSCLSGCLISPDNTLDVNPNDMFVNDGTDILVSGYTPNKSLPIVVRCQKESMTLIDRFLPSQSPTADKNGKVIYAFGKKVHLPNTCFDWSDSPISNPPVAWLEWKMAQVVYTQEVTRADGSKYQTYQYIVVPQKEAAECALRQYTTKGTFAAIVNNCARFVGPANALQVLLSRHRVYGG